MKKQIIILLTLLISITAIAQQGINYKAILKDGSGNVLAGEYMTVQFTIHKTTTTGAIVYQEDHNYTTDTNGLLILTIGTETPIGVFDTINWAADVHFLQTTITYSGGTINFDATEFMAVPYAKHAKTAETLTGGETDPIFTSSEAASITNTDVSNWNTDISTNNETITDLSLDGTNLSITEAGNIITEDLSSLFPFKMEDVRINQPQQSEIKYLVNLSWIQIYTFENTFIFFQESGYTSFSLNIDGVSSSFYLLGVDFQAFPVPSGTGKNITIRSATNNSGKTLLFEGLKTDGNHIGGILFYQGE